MNEKITTVPRYSTRNSLPYMHTYSTLYNPQPCAGLTGRTASGSPPFRAACVAPASTCVVLFFRVMIGVEQVEQLVIQSCRVHVKGQSRGEESRVYTYTEGWRVANDEGEGM